MFFKDNLCAMKAYARIGNVRMVLGGRVFIVFFFGLCDGMLLLRFAYRAFRLYKFINPIDRGVVLRGLLYSNANALKGIANNSHLRSNAYSATSVGAIVFVGALVLGNCRYVLRASQSLIRKSQGAIKYEN